MTEQRFCDTPYAERTITLGQLRAAAKNFGPVKRPTFVVHFGPDLKAEVLDLPNFTAVEKYRVVEREEGELGRVESFRMVMQSDMPPKQWDISVEVCP